MKRLRLILLVTLLMCFCSAFVVHAGREGMSAVKADDTEQVWVYYTGERNSFLKNEWKQVWDNWYYFGEDGKSKQSTWVEIDEKWYYFDQWSVMLHDTTTPDGYQVGADGARIVDAAAQPIAEPAVESSASVASATKPQTWAAKYPYIDGMVSNSESCKYVINTNTGKVHKPGCSSVKDMAVENTQYYGGEFSALTSGGYTSCGRCHAE